MARWLGVEAIPSHQVDAELTEEVAQLRRAGFLGGLGRWRGIVAVGNLYTTLQARARSQCLLLGHMRTNPVPESFITTAGHSHLGRP